MQRLLMISLLSLIVLFSVGTASLGFGYYSHRQQIQPIFDLAERIIVKGRRELGMPTETHSMVDRIETTYLTMRGSVYLLPKNDFKTGGALTLWGSDIIALHASGETFYLDSEIGFAQTDLQVPDNQLSAYVSLAEAEYPSQFPRPDAIRYNDIEFIESLEFRGLALSYTYIDIENRCYRNRISVLPIDNDVASIRDLTATASDWEQLYDSKPCLEFNDSRELIVGYMAGGRIAFKAPNLLYLGNGEYHREGFYRPDAGIQSLESDYGKTVEINLTTGESRHFSIGHRNLQGIEVDAEGRLWTTEHGMRGGDELNLIRDGENYGWPLENLGTLYSGVPAPTEGRVGRHEIYQAPVYAWLPSAAVSSLALVDGFHETWDKDLLIGSLRGRTLFRARIRDERLIFLEAIPIGQRVRDVMQSSKDEIALLLDTNEVVILKVEPRNNWLDGLVDGLVDEGMPTLLAETAHDILTGCNECHSFEENVHGAGPSLHKLAGRDIASTSFASYSAALLNVTGNWDETSLVAYLTDPSRFAPGTSMTGLGVGHADDASATAKAFEWLTRNAEIREDR